MKAVAIRFTDLELIKLGSRNAVIEYIWSRLRWKCYACGIAWNDYIMVQITGDMPGSTLIELVTWGAAKGHEVEPTPGYDADGRECWEYPK